MRFSASRLSAWMECSLAARYRYSERLPRRQSGAASFGTVVHHALQTYYDSRGNKDLALKTFKQNWFRPERLGVAPDYYPPRTSFAQYRQRGIEMIERVHEEHRWQGFTVVATEQPFLVPFGEHELTGFIDLIGIEKSGTGTELLQIIDFKTSSKIPSPAALALDVQFTCYAYAVSQREFWVGVDGDPKFNGVVNGEWLWETVAKSMPVRCIWWALYNGRRIDAGPRVEADYGRLYRVCAEVEKADRMGIAVPKIGEACNLCDYQEMCSLSIPQPIERLNDPTDPNRWI